MAAVVAGLLAAAACQRDGERGPDPQVEAFKRERVVTFKPPGGRLTFSTEDEEGSALGKPILAMAMRVYSFDDAESAHAGRLAVVDVAEADGWRVTDGRAQSGETAWAAKTLPTGDAMLTIDDYPHDDGGFRLLVRAQGRTCPPILCER